MKSVTAQQLLCVNPVYPFCIAAVLGSYVRVIPAWDKKKIKKIKFILYSEVCGGKTGDLFSLAFTDITKGSLLQRGASTKAKY